ncbi:MAG: Txe/YoeB family addiction module toxin [Bacteroidetes bacterium]|jgi:toxin YoeB|nr:Txe/YoeB family addiction module toxin [Bacteroidota bacterium]MBT7094105.1 Txe/YoeB family addiction module toxin [Bacteroidota bacterium]
MITAWTDRAWDEYLYWQKHDKQILKRINKLINDIKRHPKEGIGTPEPLRFELSGKWSRRINKEHRLVYQTLDDMIVIFQCRYHY